MLVTVGVSYYGLSLFLKPLRDEHGWSNAVVSGATGTFFVVSGVAGFLAGPWIDRLGPRRFMAAGIVMTGTAAASIGFVEEIWHLYAAYSVMAVAYGLGAIVPVSTLMARWFIHDRGKATMISSTGVSLGGAMLVPLGALLDRRRRTRAGGARPRRDRRRGGTPDLVAGDRRVAAVGRVGARRRPPGADDLAGRRVRAVPGVDACRGDADAHVLGGDLGVLPRTGRHDGGADLPVGLSAGGGSVGLAPRRGPCRDRHDHRLDPRPWCGGPDRRSVGQASDGVHALRAPGAGDRGLHRRAPPGAASTSWRCCSGSRSATCTWCSRC